MKLQCACGAKYAFDALPEMLNQPVKFVCPGCGLDSSDFVNQLIRQEFGGQATPSAPPPPLPPPLPPPPASGASSLKISQAAPPAAPVSETPATSRFCARHRQPATEKCRVCHKPVCPKCLELFGYFCSPLCKGKAEVEGLDVPVYAGQKDVVEAAFWQKTGWIAGGIGVLFLLLIGAWTWYAWFGSVPHPCFSVRFADTDRAYSGQARLVGRDQLVFLHGGTLARYDLKTSRPVWSQELITPRQIADTVAAENEAESRTDDGGGYHAHPSGADLERSAKQWLQSGLSLHVSNRNVWVDNGDQLTLYDYDSGKVTREVTLPDNGGQLVESRDELQVVGAQSVMHVNLATGDSRLESFGPPGAPATLPAPSDAVAGLPGTGGNAGQPLDPARVEAQARNLKLPAQIALPALLGNARHEQQLEAALRDDLPKKLRSNGVPAPPAMTETSRLVAGQTGFALFSFRLLEEHLVTRSAMKAPPRQSVLDGDLNTAKTGEAANEILNEMQRNNGGDTVTEDQSRYQVTVHLPNAASATDWTGEVVGPPQLFVLPSVNVVAAGKNLVVLDKMNKLLWSASLTYPVPEVLASRLFSRHGPAYGEGPCVERDGSLYVFDQAVLSAFDLASGNARWRLPSIGVVGLFFDDQNNLYVNTTTGNPDDIKYSRQIDLSRKTESVVSKVDARTGKTLWSVKPGGFVSYLSGKFIYVMESYDPNPTDQDVLNDLTAGLQKPAYLHLSRLRPSDGRVLWDYYDRDRCPVNWHFDGNSIELVFKREVQVLHYLTF
jgi:hypothetical protein